MCHTVPAAFSFPLTGAPPDTTETWVILPSAAVTVIPRLGLASTCPGVGVIDTRTAVAVVAACGLDVDCWAPPRRPAAWPPPHAVRSAASRKALATARHPRVGGRGAHMQARFAASVVDGGCGQLQPLGQSLRLVLLTIFRPVVSIFGRAVCLLERRINPTGKDVLMSPTSRPWTSPGASCSSSATGTRRSSSARCPGR